MTKTILAVDDSDSIRMMVAFSLTQVNHHVIEAGNGRTALEKLNECQVDMMITDLDMPEMDGIQLIRTLRSMPEHRKIPVIVLTTQSDTALKHKAREYGANAWIVKPFKPKQLQELVGRFLN